MNTTEPATLARRPLPRRRVLGGAAALLAAGGGGTAWALDRYVIQHPEISIASSQWSSADTAASASPSVSVPANSAATTATGITFAQDTFGSNIVEDTSTIARVNGARWAVNGDYYGFRSTGIVVRSGTAFRDKGAREGLALYRDGTMTLFDETATNAARLVADGVWQTLSFGPGIVADGQDRRRHRIRRDRHQRRQPLDPGTPRDILRVAEATAPATVVLGGRRFTGHAPARGRIGNAVSRLVFRALTGARLHDTQTGLRGHPAELLTWLGGVEGGWFEYESNLLLQARTGGVRVDEIEIETVYLDANASSPFRPVRDSLGIYAPLLGLGGSSLMPAAVDWFGVITLMTLTADLLTSVVLARLVSGTLNFTLNRDLVFADRGDARVSLWRYASRRCSSRSAGGDVRLTRESKQGRAPWARPCVVCARGARLT